MVSDFFIEEADSWRNEVWSIIKKRPDVTFSLLTKRADRIKKCLPDDWQTGYQNVTFAVSCENQKRADERIPYLLDVPISSRWISLKPFVGAMNLEKYLSTGKIDTVLVGGENYLGRRPLYYEWVKEIHDECVKYNVKLIFAQTGNIFIKDGKEYKIYNRTDQQIQALKSGLYYPARDTNLEIKKIMDRKELMKKKRTKK